MTKRKIHDVQEYLTIIHDDGKMVYQIVNVELLLRRHSPEAVISFLSQLQTEYRKKLSKLIKEDKTNSRINEIVAKRFRIKMAINMIRNNQREENAA